MPQQLHKLSNGNITNVTYVVKRLWYKSNIIMQPNF